MKKKSVILSAVIVLGLWMIWVAQYAFWWSLFWTDIYKQTLAWEAVPFDSLHQFNIERFDRELAVVRLDEAQVQMNWKRAWIFKPMIEKKLSAAWLPLDLFYLAVAESYLRDNVVSSAWAAWLWQFMPATAKSYGLRVDEYVDERYDAEKSTDAAIQYLKKAYDKFWNWTLAMASYNRGINGIANDMANQYQSSFYDLWENNETSRYIFRIIAAKEVLKNPSRYFDVSKWWWQYSAPDTMEVELTKTDDLAVWAAGKWYTYAEIRYLNPWIRKNALPEGVWKVKVYKR